MADSADAIANLARTVREAAEAAREVVRTSGRIHPEHLTHGELLRARQELLELHSRNADNNDAIAETLEVIAAVIDGRHHPRSSYPNQS